MLKLFPKVSFSLIIILFTVSLFILPSCKKYDNSTQIRRIDTLINWNNKAKGMLIIDAQAIKMRVDSMKIKISLLDSNKIKSTGVQLKSDLVQYNGLMLRYIDFLDNYAVAEFDNSVNSRFLDDLKKKIVDHKIQNKSLDTLMNHQEKIIQSHLTQTQEIVNTIFSIEEMYQRLNTRINSIYEININIRKEK